MNVWLPGQWKKWKSWELSAKQHCQSSPFTSKLGQIGQFGSDQLSKWAIKASLIFSNLNHSLCDGKAFQSFSFETSDTTCDIICTHCLSAHIWQLPISFFFFTEKIKKNIMSLAFKTNHNIFYISLLLNIVFIVVIMKYLDLSFALPIQIEYINEPSRKIYSKLPKKVRVL